MFRSFLERKPLIPRLIRVVPVVLLLVGTVFSVYLLSQTQDLQSKAATPLSGQLSALQSLKIFGQTDITQTTRSYTSNFGIYHASGIHVDRSSTPNKVYVVDTGNSRILGYNGVGYCSQSPTLACTTNTDCGGGNTCQITGAKPPDIIIGQPNPTAGSCNRDNNTGVTQQPGADTLCLMGYANYANNTAETWMRTSIDTDAQGNLYVPDFWNNRVLKYNSPFTTDTLADSVLGQASYTSNTPNRAADYYASSSTPTNQSLHLNFGPPDFVSSRGVSVDAQNNVWVADTFNNRVLRFPPGSTTADLVVGQTSFSTTGCTTNTGNASTVLDKLCTPTLAKIDPKTGQLYVIDEYPQSFRARILVFNPPFSTGMSASKILTPKQPLVTNSSGNQVPFTNWGGVFGDNQYVFQATGLTFNPLYNPSSPTPTAYTKGVFWVNELSDNRTLLLDGDGNIQKVIGAKNSNLRGGDSVYAGCNNIETGYHVSWPGGSIGLDSDNNIYLADEQYHRISRYALPYTTYMNGTVECLPEPNGGLFPGTSPNVTDQEKSTNALIASLLSTTEISQKIGEAVGTLVFQNQLLVLDQDHRLKVWNDYLQKANGSKPDFIISSLMPTRIWFGNAVDELNRLWMFNEHGLLRVQQLPITQNNQAPLQDFIKLYWADDPTKTAFTYKLSETGITFDSVNKAVYLSDLANNRILRIKNYADFTNPAGLAVDMVIGQPNKTASSCDSTPSANKLCSPHALQFDKVGNLYVVENTYECHGNDRITMFTKESLANASGMFPNISASKVFVAPSFTQKGPCAYTTVNQPGSPVTVAFTSQNQMVVGNDGYYGDRTVQSTRQLWFYNDPITKQTPDGYITLPIGTPGEVVIDSQNNLVVQDHTWDRVLVVNPQTDPSILVSLNGQPLYFGTAPTATPLPTATPTVFLTPTPTPIKVSPTPTKKPTPTPTKIPTPTPTKKVPTPTPTKVPTPTPTPTPTPSDTTPPVVSISAPRNNAIVSRSHSTTIVAAASDSSGINKVEFYVNNVLKCTDTLSTYTCSWSVPSTSGTRYTLTAKAYDQKGNSSVSPSIIVTGL